MKIRDYQKKVDHWIQTIGVRYFSELTNMAILTEETGELARLLARTYGDQSFKKDQEPDVIKHNIADEIADIIFVLTCLSNQMGIDLEKAIEMNMEKKTRRDSIRHKQNKKLSD